MSLDLPDGVYKRDDGRWIRLCSVCNSEISHLRRNYCIGAHNIEQPCKRCSNINNNPSGMVGAVRMSWFQSFGKSAATRGYEWNITPEFIDAMYNEQQGRCALSGLSIGWSITGWDHTASIDRIDNDCGYTENNVQLVHKQINMLRGSLSIDEFIQLCGYVTQKTKW